MNRALPASSASSGGTRVMDGSQSLHGVLQAGGCCAAKNEAKATKQSNNAAQVLSIQRSVLPRIHARKAVRHAVPHAVREAFHNEEEESVAQRLLRLCERQRTRSFLQTLDSRKSYPHPCGARF